MIPILLLIVTRTSTRTTIRVVIRPLRRAVIRLLEDTLAQQCLSKTLYPGTKLLVTRLKNGNSTFDYTNEVKVEIDYSGVDPKLIDPNYGESKQGLRNRLENI